MREASEAVRRFIAKLALFLVLGAIINFAVVWACQRWGSFSYADGPPLGLKQGQSPNSPPPDFPYEFTPEWRQDGTSFGQRRTRYIDDYLHKPLYIFSVEYRSGWPLPSLYGEQWIAVGPRHGPPAGAEATRYLWSESADDNNVLPWHPIVPGFAINTIFYAAILWLPFAALGVFRRRRRIKRGLCPACAYPIGTSDVCTECGKAVKA